MNEEKIAKIYEKVMSFVLPKDKMLPYIRCGIGDVLDWIEKNIVEHNNDIYQDAFRRGAKYLEICNIWKDKRKSIEHQSEECISFIYSLIAKGTRE